MGYISRHPAIQKRFDKLLLKFYEKDEHTTTGFCTKWFQKYALQYLPSAQQLRIWTTKKGDRVPKSGTIYSWRQKRSWNWITIPVFHKVFFSPLLFKNILEKNLWNFLLILEKTREIMKFFASTCKLLWQIWQISGWIKMFLYFAFQVSVKLDNWYYFRCLNELEIGITGQSESIPRFEI